MSRETGKSLNTPSEFADSKVCSERGGGFQVRGIQGGHLSLIFFFAARCFLCRQTWLCRDDEVECHRLFIRFEERDIDLSADSAIA